MTYRQHRTLADGRDLFYFDLLADQDRSAADTRQLPETATSSPGQGCPNSSKIGTFTLQSPLLVEETTSFEQLIEGSVYLAAPGENPFGALVGIYLVEVELVAHDFSFLVARNHGAGGVPWLNR